MLPPSTSYTDIDRDRVFTASPADQIYRFPQKCDQLHPTQCYATLPAYSQPPTSKLTTSKICDYGNTVNGNHHWKTTMPPPFSPCTFPDSTAEGGSISIPARRRETNTQHGVKRVFCGHATEESALITLLRVANSKPAPCVIRVCGFFAQGFETSGDSIRPLEHSTRPCKDQQLGQKQSQSFLSRYGLWRGPFGAKVNGLNRRLDHGIDGIVKRRNAKCWTVHPTMPSFEELLGNVQHLLQNPSFSAFATASEERFSILICDSTLCDMDVNFFPNHFAVFA